jgi:hypothetical protein
MQSSVLDSREMQSQTELQMINNTLPEIQLVDGKKIVN